jgi:uncharacterized surface protein with fasciclin (FAS1) repeats
LDIGARHPRFKASASESPSRWKFRTAFQEFAEKISNRESGNPISPRLRKRGRFACTGGEPTPRKFVTSKTERLSMTFLRQAMLAVAIIIPAFAAPAVAGSMSKSASNTVVDVAAGNQDFSTLVAALKAADLVDALKGKGPFTVFAPTNAAFAALPAGTVEDLLKPENKAKLQAILKFHVIPARIEAADLAGKKLTSPATLQGATLPVDGTMGVKVGDATVVAPDVEASNGVIHVIDKVLLPAN